MPPNRCCCSDPRRLPLCGLCRALGRLAPRVRLRLTQLASGYGWVLTREDVEDLTQQVLSALARSGHPADRLGALATCIARRRLIDFIRRSATRGRYEPWGDRIDETAARPEVSDLALDVMKAMDQMSAEVRTVFIACGIEQRTREDTMALFGLSLSAVRKRYAEALRIVAEVLGIDESEENCSPRAEKSPADDSAS